MWASRLLGHPLPERVAGIDLFEALLELADREGHAVYLLGAKPDGAGPTVEEVVATRWPGADIAGSRDGYFDRRSPRRSPTRSPHPEPTCCSSA